MRKIAFGLAILGLFFSGAHAAFAEDDLFDSKTAAVYLEKGLSYLNAKKYDAAIKELEESVSIAPDAEGYYYLGYAYYLKGRKGDTESRKKSIENFDKVYELNPNFTPTRYKPVEPVPAATAKSAVEQGTQKETVSSPSLTSEPTGTTQEDQKQL